MRSPNIVFVFADQLRAQTVGFMGNGHVRTPNMDRMAREGVVFRNTVANAPVCTPWRAAFLTGQYPLTNGIFLNDLRLPTDRPTLGTVLRDTGYDTAYIGKWHLDGNERSAFTPPGPRRQGFDFWAVGNCTHSYLKSLYYRDTPDPLYWEGYDAEGQTSLAMDFIRSRTGQKPFGLVMSWGPPHNPYREIPQRHLDMYGPGDIDVRANCPDPNFDDLTGYYAHVTALDEQLGRLYTCLEEEGKLDDTVFVFTSDHGDMLGSHGLQRKQHPWEESIMVPFVMRCPGQAKPGHTIESPLNVVDLMPTLLGLAGVPVPNTVEGLDHSPAIRGEAFQGNEASLTMSIAPFAEYRGQPWRGVRTERHTYVRYLDGSALLFDNQTDPCQMSNLAGNTEHKDLETRLSATLDRLLAERGDELLPAQTYIDRYGYTVQENGAIGYTN